MSTSVGNSKVYLFLAKTERNLQENGSKIKEWQLYADKKYGNADGVLSQAEFEQFITAEYYGAMGENLGNYDFNIFWSSADTDKIDFQNDYGNTVNGAYNLSAKEIEALDKEMEDFVKLDKLCENAKANLTDLFGDREDQKQWMSLVTTKLALALEEWRAAGRPDGDFEKYMTQGKGLQKFATIQAEATATVQKDNVIDEWLKDKSRYWDELAELQPPFDVMEFINQSGVVDKLVKKYVTPETTLNDIRGILIDIREKMEVEIKKALALKGLNEKGEAIQQPELDGDGEVIVDGDGNIVVDKTNETITDENIQSWTAQLIAKLGEKDFAQTIKDAGYENYLQLFKDAGITYITNTLINQLKAENPTFSEFEGAFEKITGAVIAEDLLKDPTITDKIKTEMAWQDTTAKLKGWFGSSFDTTILSELGNDYLKTKVKDSGILETIKQTILGDVRGFFNNERPNESEYAGFILPYTREKIAELLGGDVESGYNLDDSKYYGTDGKINRTNKSHEMDSIYQAGIAYANKLADAQKLQAYAQFASGYLNDVINMGKNCAALVEKHAGGKNITAQALINEFGTADKINKVVNNVQQGLAGAIKLDEAVGKETEGADNTGDPESDKFKTWQEDPNNGFTNLVMLAARGSNTTTSLSKSDSLKNAKAWALNDLDTVLSVIVTKMSEKYDSAVLETVSKKVKAYYTEIINNISGIGGINRKGDERTMGVTSDCPQSYRNTSYTFVRRADSSKWDDGIKDGNKPMSGVYWFHDGEDNKDSIILDKMVIAKTFIEFFKHFAK